MKSFFRLGCFIFVDFLLGISMNDIDILLVSILYAIISLLFFYCSSSDPQLISDPPQRPSASDYDEFKDYEHVRTQEDDQEIEKVNI